MADRGAVEMLVKRSIWEGRRVLVTGHTGFKGGWLALWLHELGADVTIDLKITRLMCTKTGANRGESRWLKPVPRR